MLIETSDFHWDAGITPERETRYYELLPLIDSEALTIASKHNSGIRIRIETPAGLFHKAMRNGVQICAPVVLLFADQDPSKENLRKTVDEITDTLPVSYVVYCIDGRVPVDLEKTLETAVSRLAIA